MLLGFMWASNQVKSLNINRTGFIIAIIATFIGFAVNLIFAIGEGACYCLALHWAELFPLMGIILFVILNPLMSIASFYLFKYFRHFRGLGIAFIALAVVMVIFYIIWGVGDYAKPSLDLSAIFDGGYYDSNGIKYRFLGRDGLDILTYIALILALSATLFYFWKNIKIALRKNELKTKIEEIVPQMTEEKVSATDHSRYMPREAAPVAEAPVVDESIVNQLMHFDNDGLRKVVDRASFYTPEVVAKAREILARREAWEQIKDLPDDELLEMTMARKGLFADNIVEAASMELYQRDSRLLREQFMALTPDVLFAIASGTAPTPEGIRLAAKKYLSKSTRP